MSPVLFLKAWSDPTAVAISSQECYTPVTVSGVVVLEISNTGDNLCLICSWTGINNDGQTIFGQTMCFRCRTVAGWLAAARRCRLRVAMGTIAHPPQYATLRDATMSLGRCRQMTLLSLCITLHTWLSAVVKDPSKDQSPYNQTIYRPIVGKHSLLNCCALVRRSTPDLILLHLSFYTFNMF